MSNVEVRPTPPAPRIGILGDRNPELHVHAATEAALSHVADPLPFEWIPTESVGDAPAVRLARYAGLLVSPGSPYRSMEGALAAVRHAREHGVPLLGTCGGFQHVVVEFARDVLGVADADHEETSPGGRRLAVTALACSLAGQQAPVHFVPGSRVAAICGADAAVEPFFCRYGLSAEFRSAVEAHGLRVTAADDRGEPRVLELDGHPFFVATLYVPQARSRPGAPHPLVGAFVAAARARAAQLGRAA